MEKNCRDVIEALNKKIADYEEVLGGIFEAKKSISIVRSEPFQTEKGMMYRVSSGSSDQSQIVLFSGKDIIFGNQYEKLELNEEVIVYENAIVGIVPKELRPKKEEKDFQRIEWDQIGGLKSQIIRIRESVELPLKHAKIAKSLGVQSMKGILLWGPPGCGKTLIARAIASSILKGKKAGEGAFTYIKGAEMLNPYVGATEQQIRQIFDSARNYTQKTGQPAVIFFDEADAIMPERGTRFSTDVDKTIVPTFLAEMSGLQDHDPLVILSSNHPDSIDKALLREGRCDLHIEIQRPNMEDAKDIFMIHLKKVKCSTSMDELAELGCTLLKGKGLERQLSGALIETLVKSAANSALSRKISDTASPLGLVYADMQNAISNHNSIHHAKSEEQIQAN